MVQLIAEGKQMKEAAAVLNVSTRTVAFHKYRAMEKLGMRSTADLVRFAITEQLLPPPSAAIGS